MGIRIYYTQPAWLEKKGARMQVDVPGPQVLCNFDANY